MPRPLIDVDEQSGCHFSAGFHSPCLLIHQAHFPSIVLATSRLSSDPLVTSTDHIAGMDLSISLASPNTLQTIPRGIYW